MLIDYRLDAVLTSRGIRTTHVKSGSPLVQYTMLNRFVVFDLEK